MSSEERVDRSRARYFLSAIAICLLVTLDLAAAQEKGTPQSSRDQSLPEIPAAISIIPEVTTVVLEPATGDATTGGERTPGLAPFGLRGTIPVTVRSRIPLWGASITLTEVEGPEGRLPPDRFWVRTEETEGEFRPLDQSVPVVVGDFKLPEREVTVEVELRPSWDDPPGRYDAEVVIEPFLPDMGGPTPPPPTFEGEVLGVPQGVSMELDIPSLIFLSVQQTELEFDADSGPGEYAADQEVSFRVMSNMDAWRVECRAAPFVSGEYEIPGERLSWERVDRYGRRIAGGTLGANPTVLEGYETNAETEVRLRFSLLVTWQDRPGLYQGTISLMGIPGP